MKSKLSARLETRAVSMTDARGIELPATFTTSADEYTAQVQCRQREETPVTWAVDVAVETTLTYGPGGTAGKAEAEARRRTTCQVFSTDPVDVRGYTRLGETIVPVKNWAGRRHGDVRIPKDQDDAGGAGRKISGPLFKSEAYPGAVAFGSTRTAAMLDRLSQGLWGRRYLIRE